MTRRGVTWFLATILLSAGCGAPVRSSSASTYTVVATSSVFADLASMALGDSARVISLVPAGFDVHTFEPSPETSRVVSTADLLLMNGLGLDDWVQSILDASPISTKNVLRLGEQIEATDHWVYLQEGGSGGVDPHIWLDPAGALIYIKRIAARVVQDLPDARSAIESSLATAIAAIESLDTSLKTSFASIASRKIITFHDAFGYFVRAYGLEVVGVAVEAPGQDPSAQQIAELIDLINTTGVRAIFSEAQFPSKVLDQIAAETGATVLGSLYSDALGPSPADSYLGMMRANGAAIAQALGGVAP
ncbi:MAG: metal ABC transporter substrate-binding protein [Candidatus Limnocylindrus sp.]